MEGKEGFTVRNIPQQTQRVCNGCKYHKRERQMCGHNYVTDDYICQHPEITREMRQFALFGVNGRIIAKNAREEPETPAWCPFLNENK